MNGRVERMEGWSRLIGGCVDECVDYPEWVGAWMG